MNDNTKRETQNESGRNRRKQYIVNAAFQWRYAAVLALVVFFSTCLFSCVLYGVLHQQARARMMHPENYVASTTTVIIFFGVVCGALAALGVGLWSAVSTQKICGPLLVLERYLLELAQGRIPNPRPLRRKDEFKELYATFAKAVETLRDGRQAELSTLNQGLSMARAALESDDDSRQQALQSLVTRLEALQRDARRALGTPTEESQTAETAAARPRDPMGVG